MRPVVNTVDDSQSRIRHLEEQVQRLRLELDQKENAPVATKARDENHTLNMQERLAAQLAQNQELIKHRETLARYSHHCIPRPVHFRHLDTPPLTQDSPTFCCSNTLSVGTIEWFLSVLECTQTVHHTHCSSCASHMCLQLTFLSTLQNVLEIRAERLPA